MILMIGWIIIKSVFRWKEIEKKEMEEFGGMRNPLFR